MATGNWLFIFRYLGCLLPWDYTVAVNRCVKRKWEGTFLRCDSPRELREIPQQLELLPGKARLLRSCYRLFPLFPFSAQELCFISAFRAPPRVQTGSCKKFLVAVAGGVCHTRAALGRGFDFCETWAWNPPRPRPGEVFKGHRRCCRQGDSPRAQCLSLPLLLPPRGLVSLYNCTVFSLSFWQ